MTINMHTPVDADARQKATSPYHSYVVSAPAGSGKTGLLTLRVLRLLSVVEKPEEILCITFTRKAAHEMHERIFKALNDALEFSRDDRAIETLEPYEKEIIETALAALDQDRKKNWRLMQTPKRLNVSTIDGFCKGLCNQLPFSSGLGTNAGILELPQIEFRNAITDWLNNVFADHKKNNPDNHDTHQALAALIAHLGGNLEKLVDLFVQLLNVRDQWLPLLYRNASQHKDDADSFLKMQFESTLQAWVDDAIQDVQLHFRPYEADLYELLRYAQKATDSELPHLETLLKYDEFVCEGSNAAAYWRAMAELFLTKNAAPGFRKKLDKNNGFPPGDSKDEKLVAKDKKMKMMAVISGVAESGLDIHAFGSLRQLPEPEFNQSQWSVLSALFTILPQLVAYLRLRFIEAGATDFLEFSLASVAALNAESGDIDLLQRLDYTIKHILIDEFQDTSQIQLSLLQALTAEWQPNDGRTLFLVGDAMQSCYSFRNANVGIFLNMREHGLDNIAMAPLDLSVNFRSTSAIVDWVNHQFSDAFPEKNEPYLGAVKYIPSDAFNKNDNNSHVRCVAIDASPSATGEKPSASESALKEAQFICEEILTLKKQDPKQSIAILVKGRSHVKALIPVLSAYDIDYQAVDIDPLLTKQHISDIQSLTKILTQPLDKLAWLACFRAPFCALSHSDLYHTFCQTDKESTLGKLETPEALAYSALSSEDLSEGGRARLTRFLGTYQQYAPFVGRRSLAEQVELMWCEVGGPEQLTRESENVDIQRYLALIQQYEKQGQLEWQNIENAIQKLYATPSPRSEHPVQIMTMHKSKGLEFDSVFLPQLHKSPRSDSPELLYWLERANDDQADFLLSPLSPAFSDNADSITEFIKSQKKLKAQIEESRVFYVACTRAKARLYLSAALALEEVVDADVGQHSTALFKAPSKHSLLGKIWPTVGAEFAFSEKTAVREAAQPATSLNQSTTELAFTNTETDGKSAPAIKAMPLEWQSGITSIKNSVLSEVPDHEDEMQINLGLDVYEEFTNDRSAATVGNVFHSLLQQLVEQPDLITAEDTQTVSAWVKNSLRHRGLSQQEQHRWSEQIATCVSSLANNKTALWLLNPAHAHSSCELELAERNGQHLRHHIIDRSFIEDGVRWIIDYKTAQPTAGQDLADFEQEQIQLHTQQLTRYRDVIRKYDERIPPLERPKRTRAALYFPFIPHLLIINSLDLIC